jgi:hypothetical protein
MDWRWANPPGYGLPDARAEIGDFSVLVLTERVSLSGTMPWHHSEREALRWAAHAWQNGNGGSGAATLLYATWVSRDTGPDAPNPWKDPEGHIAWRDRLPLEYARGLAIRDHANAGLPDGAPPVRMIPGPPFMAALHDAVAAGAAPGIATMDALFVDDIHLSPLGAYAVALLHYAVIYGRDPRALPPRPAPGAPADAATDGFLRGLAWTVATTLPETGLAGAA